VVAGGVVAGGVVVGGVVTGGGLVVGGVVVGGGVVPPQAPESAQTPHWPLAVGTSPCVHHFAV
jgi:hypothetical protein